MAPVTPKTTVAKHPAQQSCNSHFLLKAQRRETPIKQGCNSRATTAQQWPATTQQSPIGEGVWLRPLTRGTTAQPCQPCHARARLRSRLRLRSAGARNPQKPHPHFADFHFNRQTSGTASCGKCV